MHLLVHYALHVVLLRVDAVTTGTAVTTRNDLQGKQHVLPKCYCDAADLA